MRVSQPIAAHMNAEGDMVSTSGISFDDYSRMSTRSKSQNCVFHRNGVPAFVLSVSKLRAVIVHVVEVRAGFRNPLPGTHTQRLKCAQKVLDEKRAAKINILGGLCERYVALKNAGDPEFKTLEPMIENLDTVLRVNDHIAATIAGVLYLSWRCNMDSPAVGAALGMKPPHVRQILRRANIIARKLFGEVDATPLKFSANTEEQRRHRREYMRARYLKKMSQMAETVSPCNVF